MPIHKPRNAKERQRRKEAYAQVLYSSNKKIKQKSMLLKVYPWLVCGLAAVFYCYEVLLRMSPSVMEAELMRSFRIDAWMFGNLSAFYYYAYTPMQIPAGMMMDKYGPRRILTLACACCALGTLVFAMSDMIGVAMVGRFLIGFGSAFAFVGILKLATIWLPADKFSFVTGLATTLGMLGAAFGEILLAYWVEAAGWKISLNTAGALGLLLIPAIYFLIKDTPKKVQKRALLRPEFSYSHLFKVLAEILRNPQIWIIGTIGCLLYLPVTAFAELWAPPYFKTRYNMNSEQAALMVVPLFLGWALGGPITGMLSEKFKTRKIPLMISSITGFLIFSYLLYNPQLETNSVSVILFILGACISSQILVFSLGCENSPASSSGTAVAATNFLVMLGATICQPLIGKVLDLAWDGEGIVNGLKVYTVQNYLSAFMVFPACFALSAILCFFLKETHCKQVVKDRVI